MIYKFCAGCQNTLPLSMFTLRKTGPRKSQPVSKCKKCRLQVQGDYRGRINSSGESLYEAVEWPSKLRRFYGIEPSDYYRMLKEQGGGCAICLSKVPGYRGKKKFAVDHCHVTGRVRGVLCFRCNKAIGLLMDDIEIINNAAKYLAKYLQEN